MASAHHRSATLRKKAGKRALWMLLSAIVALVLIVLLAGSPVATMVANRKLAELPAYVGHVGLVKIELWRGGITLDNFVLHERGHEDDVPRVRVPKASLRISWSALLHGKLGGKAEVDSPKLITVKRDAAVPKAKEAKEEKKTEQKQKAEETKKEIERWQDALARAFPMEITRLEVRNGSVRFVDRTHQPEIDVGVDGLHLVATGLGNRPEAEAGPLPAKVEVEGVMTGNGKLKISAQADPLSPQPRFATNFELREVDLPALNNFLLAYSDADVSRGTFELFLEVKAADGAYEGYIKPFFKDLDFKNPSDKDKNFAQRAKEKVVSAVSTVLKNKEEDKVATKAPFAGNFADNQVDVWTTIVNLLRNAFIQGLRGGFDGQSEPKPETPAAAPPGP